jgi:hypothetical protein
MKGFAPEIMWMALDNERAQTGKEIIHRFDS